MATRAAVAEASSEADRARLLGYGFVEFGVKGLPHWINFLQAVLRQHPAQFVVSEREAVNHRFGFGMRL